MSAVEVIRTFVADNGEEQEEVLCPLCNASESELVLEGQDIMYNRPGNYRVVRCRSCSLEYVNPRPTFKSLGVHYPDDYFCYQPVDDSPAFLRPVLKSFSRGAAERRLGFIEKAIGKVKPEMSLLDVGCGLNELLYWIKELRGCEGLGVDMKDTMVEHVRERLKMPIVHGTLENAGLEAGRFDVVMMIEYLEHELDPRGALSEARRVTKPGGVLALEIPYTGGWPARAFGNRWFNLDVPRHLIFFSHDTLKRALNECGFELEQVDTFSIPFYVGSSVLHWLGYRSMTKNPVLTPFLAGILGLPFLPATGLMPEFTFAVARAR